MSMITPTGKTAGNAADNSSTDLDSIAKELGLKPNPFDWYPGEKKNSPSNITLTTWLNSSNTPWRSIDGSWVNLDEDKIAELRRKKRGVKLEKPELEDFYEGDAPNPDNLLEYLNAYEEFYSNAPKRNDFDNEEDFRFAYASWSGDIKYLMQIPGASRGGFGRPITDSETKKIAENNLKKINEEKETVAKRFQYDSASALEEEAQSGTREQQKEQLTTEVKQRRISKGDVVPNPFFVPAEIDSEERRQRKAAGLPDRPPSIEEFLTFGEWNNVFANEYLPGGEDYDATKREDFLDWLIDNGSPADEVLAYDDVTLQQIWEGVGKFAIEKYKKDRKTFNIFALKDSEEVKTFLQDNVIIPEEVRREANYAVNYASFRNLYRENGIPIDEETLDRLSNNVARGVTTFEAESFRIRKNQISKLVPMFRDEILEGENVRDLIAPYLQRQATLLEKDAGDIDLDNKYIRSILNNKNDKGEYELPSLYDYEVMVQQDPEWKNTFTAKSRFDREANFILRSFGLE